MRSTENNMNKKSSAHQRGIKSFVCRLAQLHHNTVFPKECLLLQRSTTQLVLFTGRRNASCKASALHKKSTHRWLYFCKLVQAKLFQLKSWPQSLHWSSLKLLKILNLLFKLWKSLQNRAFRISRTKFLRRLLRTIIKNSSIGN
jgi:hypothetical protein